MLKSYERVTPDILRIGGSPDELYGAENDLGFVDVIGGLTVARVGDGGKHDGKPAHLIHLHDETGHHEVGRLAVISDEIVEWMRVFPIPDALEDFVAALEKATANPLATTTQDLCWDGSPSAEVCAAELSARYGVSIVITDGQPSSGWPIVEISGLRANVRTILLNAWQYGADELDAELR